MDGIITERASDLSQSIPTDFIGTAKYLERVEILQKGILASSSANFICVMTQRGPLQISLSKQMSEIVRVGDSIIVQYQKGRWTGAMKGHIFS